MGHEPGADPPGGVQKPRLHLHRFEVRRRKNRPHRKGRRHEVHHPHHPAPRGLLLLRHEGTQHLRRAPHPRRTGSGPGVRGRVPLRGHRPLLLPHHLRLVQPRLQRQFQGISRVPAGFRGDPLHRVREDRRPVVRRQLVQARRGLGGGRPLRRDPEASARRNHCQQHGPVRQRRGGEIPSWTP